MSSTGDAAEGEPATDERPEGAGGLAALAMALGRFGLLGVVSFLVNLGLTILLHEQIGLAEEAAYAIGLVTVFVINFVACRYFVFAASSGNPTRQLLGYLLGSLGFRSAEYLAFLLVHTVLGVHYVVAIFGIQGTSTVIKFFFYRGVVFKSS